MEAPASEGRKREFFEISQAVTRYAEEVGLIEETAIRDPASAICADRYTLTVCARPASSGGRGGGSSAEWLGTF
jgi:hypothetical protein